MISLIPSDRDIEWMSGRTELRVEYKYESLYGIPSGNWDFRPARSQIEFVITRFLRNLIHRQAICRLYTQPIFKFQNICRCRFKSRQMYIAYRIAYTVRILWYRTTWFNSGLLHLPGCWTWELSFQPPCRSRLLAWCCMGTKPCWPISHIIRSV